MQQSRAIRVLLVDDHHLFRTGLRSLLAEHGFEVVGEAPSGEEALGLAGRRRPDVVVMDLNMPGMSGVEATRRLLQESPALKVLVVTVSADHDDLLQALEAGAVGYLLKGAGPDELARAVEAAAEGESALSPHVATALVERSRAHAEAAGSAAVGRLSERELEVLRLVAEGRDNAQIAEQLFLSPTTVKHHVSSILEKLGVSNRVQAAIQALRSGVV